MTALRAIDREDGIMVIGNLHALDSARIFCDRILGMAYSVMRQFIYIDSRAMMLLLILTVALLDITCEQTRRRLIGEQALT